jgi:hypothetical protein
MKNFGICFLICFFLFVFAVVSSNELSRNGQQQKEIGGKMLFLNKNN